MNLTNDARPSDLNDFELQELSEEKLRKVEYHLEVYEKLSLMFLLSEDFNNCSRDFLSKYNQLSSNGNDRNDRTLSNFILENVKSRWREKFVEGLCTIKNYMILRALGIPKSDIKGSTFDEYTATFVNRAVKSLYYMCEALDERNREKLLNLVIKDAGMNNYNEDILKVPYLEIHILYWCDRKYIKINPDGTGEFENLVKLLKKLGMAEEKFYTNLESNCKSIATTSSVSDRASEPVNKNLDDDEKVKTIRKGLLIIVNIINFKSNYDKRSGSIYDETNLRTAFGSLGFEIEKALKDPTRDEFLHALDKLKFKAKHDCIVFCILSHGTKDAVITSDAKEVLVKTIEDKFCCKELKDVMKIVILQTCRGNYQAISEDDDLASDGPKSPICTGIAEKQHYCIWYSTIEDFKSMRHKVDGTWFIQSICEAIKNKNREAITLDELIRDAKYNVSKKEGKIESGEKVTQISESKSRLIYTLRFLYKKS